GEDARGDQGAERQGPRRQNRVTVKLLPRPASTLILMRDGASGPEVLMLQRTQSAVFLGGAYVFPGGSLDESDADPRILKRIRGETKIPPAPYWVAAVRECFEEAGVLMGVDARR